MCFANEHIQGTFLVEADPHTDRSTHNYTGLTFPLHNCRGSLPRKIAARHENGEERVERERAEQEVRERCVGEEEKSREIQILFYFSLSSPQASAVLSSVLVPSVLAPL